MKKVLITICGRAGSKGFKNKNLKKEIYLKTGSMNGIKSYAGYVVDNKGDLITFCFMVNNFECSQANISKKLEQILLMIIE